MARPRTISIKMSYACIEQLRQMAGEYSETRQVPEEQLNCRWRAGEGHSKLRLMAGFQTHITVSTLAGVGYGLWGQQCGAPVATCLPAGGLGGGAGRWPALG